ncbi:Kinesin light chain, partial [Tetrabaena socialis]
TVMHSLVRAVVVSALAPALDLTVRPAAEDRVAAVLLASAAGWAKAYGSREGGSSVLAAARASQPEFAELLSLLSRMGPRQNTGGGAPPPIGRHPTAEPLLRQALDLRMKTGGEANIATAAARMALADCLAAQQDAAGAEQHYRAAHVAMVPLAAGAEKDAEKEMAVAAAAHGLGATLAAQQRSAEAEPLLKDALETRRRLLGPEHKDTGATLAALANCLGDLARYGEAEALFRADLEAATKAQGPMHPDTATAMSALAGCLQ